MTEDCIYLKDALEQEIQDKKLPEFIQHLRLLRRCSDDDDRKTINFRNNKPIEIQDDTIQVMVNVVVGKNRLPRSMNVVKKYIKAISSEVIKVKNFSIMQFIPKDFQYTTSKDDESMVITIKLKNGIIKRILIDTEAYSNILFRNAYDALELKDQHLKPHHPRVVGLGDHFIKLDGAIDLLYTVGEGTDIRVV
ncbi:hypothetical protein Ahy_A04g019155 [Arachis hypogaea]|uniref:Uncharacterized protein n=1 Tax=Arachis hypogaea TaxID=3818 RepID=A0A445DFF2_ARAHY|nr:hypothetical protein Ahy_A04g019155 [Arachis hypogaea]